MDNVIDIKDLKPCMFLIDTLTAFAGWVKDNLVYFNADKGVEQYGYVEDNCIVISVDVLNKYMADIYSQDIQNVNEEPGDTVFECWWHHKVLRNLPNDPACDFRRVGGKSMYTFKIWLKV